MKRLTPPLIVAAALVLPLMFVTPLLADEPVRPAFAHVRPLTADARDLVMRGLERSELIRNLIDHLDASDLVAYVDLSWFMPNHSGQLAFLSSAGGVRYVVIRIACGHIVPDQLAALGQQLRNAVEVADTTAIVGRASFASHYARIGIDLGREGVNRLYATETAADIGRSVMRELAAPVADFKERR
jgi:hypothetical protein